MNKNKLLNIILTICALLSIASISIYMLNFHRMPISTKTSDWSNFGSYIAGTVGPLLSLVSILFVLKSINSSNDNHETLMDFSTQDKIYNQIDNMSNILKSSIKENELFKDPNIKHQEPYSNEVCRRIYRMMSFNSTCISSIQDVARSSIRELEINLLKPEIALIIKIISLINKANKDDQELYRLMLEVKISSEERAVLYSFACKFSPDDAMKIQDNWPNFRGPYYNTPSVQSVPFLSPENSNHE